MISSALLPGEWCRSCQFFWKAAASCRNIAGRAVYWAAGSGCFRPGGDPYEALAVAIDEDAALIVEGPQGRQRLATGEISIRFLEKEDLL